MATPIHFIAQADLTSSPWMEDSLDPMASFASSKEASSETLSIDGAAQDDEAFSQKDGAATATPSQQQLKLEKSLIRDVGRAIHDFNMIEAGDRVMVCLSGGKDSYAMLEILLRLQARAPIDFELIAVNLDQKQPGFPADVLPTYLQAKGIPFHIETQDTYSVVKRVIPEGKTTCGLCSRLRRGILYRLADELKATKIALGHHLDDILHTFLLNLFYGGQLKAMPPKLRSDDGKHMVIRPLAYVREKALIRYARYQQFPIIPCNLCGSQENLKRKEMAAMLADWEQRNPLWVSNMTSALQHVAPSHLMDHGLFDFAGLAVGAGE